jgi:uncharacterized protein (DUF58 family)
MDMKRIDWGLLAKQKEWLVRQSETSEEAAGLVELLDWLQDVAVDEYGMSEETVFPGLEGAAEESRKSFVAAEVKKAEGQGRKR